MAFDGFVNKAIINELTNSIINGKIIKVHQPNKDELILGIYLNNNKYNLNICINSSNCRINLTSEKKPNPINPTSFCMLLRKHLIGAKIRKIDTIGLDRLIVFHLETFNELNDLVNKKLVVELMGKHSNIILLNENDTIIDSVRHISSDRTILPANPYTFPISYKININDITDKEFVNMVHKRSNNFISFISSHFYGFSKVHINYVVNLLNINVDNISESDIIKFYNYILNLISSINSLNVNCVIFEFNNKNDYILISSDNTSELEINNFIDNYYSSKEKNENFENYRNNVLRIILSILKKYEKRLCNINSKLEECKNMDKYKLYGELITANLYKLNNNINLETVTLNNYYDNNNSITILLDKRYSPSVNAKRFFKKYNKLKNTLEIVTTQKEDTKKELNYIESIVFSLHSASSVYEVDDIYLEIQENLLGKKIDNKKVAKNSKETSSPIKLNIDGYTVLIGKNNKQNDELTFKIASKSDLWFHAKDIQGSHVILKTDYDKDLNENIIYKCASIAAYYSKGKNSSKVEVQYTEIKNIKNPKNAKPGFVVFSKYKSILVQPELFK